MIRRVYAQNFLSFDTLDCEFASSGLTAITGRVMESDATDSNGAGKSAVIAAIEWGLFGKTTRAAKVNDVVNTQRKKDCHVHLEVQIGESELVIDRYRKDKKYKNDVIATLDEQPISGTDVRETQKKIEDVLGFDHATFTRAFLFTGADTLAVAKDEDAKSFFEKLLAIDLVEFLTRAKAHQNALQTENTKLQIERDTLSNQFQSVAAQIDQAEAERTRWQESAQREQQALQLQLSRHREEHAAAQREYESQFAVYQQTQQLLGGVAAEISSSDRDQYVREHAEQRLRDLAHQLQSLKNAVCPTCQQPLPAAQIQEQELRLLGEQEQVRATLAALPVTDVGALRARHDELSKSVEKVNREIQALTAQTTNAQRAIDKIASDLSYYGKADPHKLQLESLRELQTKAVARVEQIDDSRLELSCKIVVAEAVVKMFSRQGLRSFLLDQVIPFLNQRLAYYTSIVSGGEILVSLSATSGTGAEKFTAQIQRKDGGTTYESLSLGEQRRVDVCVALAVIDYVRTRMAAPIIFFDELFDHLDETGVEIVTNLLQETAQNFPIIIVTHNRAIQRLVENTIDVVRTPDGFSKFPY